VAITIDHRPSSATSRLQRPPVATIGLSSHVLVLLPKPSAMLYDITFTLFMFIPVFLYFCICCHLISIPYLCSIHLYMDTSVRIYVRSTLPCISLSSNINYDHPFVFPLVSDVCPPFAALKLGQSAQRGRSTYAEAKSYLANPADVFPSLPATSPLLGDSHCIVAAPFRPLPASPSRQPAP
jgi:hypothetical protein